jgi:tetratricopeptide (TPR) repeat protein
MPRSALSNIGHTAETDHRIPRREDAGESVHIIPSARATDDSPLVLFSSELKTARRGELDRELGIALIGLGSQQTSGQARLARLALPLLDASLKTRPDDRVALQAKIVALTLRKRTSDAISAAESALALDSDDERTLDLTIPLLATVGRRKEALALCQRLLALNPSVSEYHLVTAMIHAQLRQWSAASDSCQAALRLDPNNLTARTILIRSALETGDLALVRSEGQKYLRFDPPENERKVVQGWIDKARASRDEKRKD